MNTPLEFSLFLLLCAGATFIFVAAVVFFVAMFPFTFPA